MANITPKLLGLLNNQVNIELGNAALYRQLSAVANQLGFLNTESKLKSQYSDELDHFNKVFEYILDRDHLPLITGIVEPIRNAETLKEIFEIALMREKETTAELKKIRQEAINVDDQLTEIFLNDMLLEQIEEENFIYDILAQLRVAGDNAAALLLIDSQLGN